MRRKPCPWTSHPRQGRARHPLNSSKFLLARNMAPGQVILADILEFGGPATDLLISNANVGKASARCCGGHNIVLMRGHGSTVIADSLRLAVFRAAYAELNARDQCEAASLGEVVYLSKEEGEAAVRSVEKQSERAWNLWKEKAGRMSRR